MNIFTVVLLKCNITYSVDWIEVLPAPLGIYPTAFFFFFLLYLMSLFINLCATL